MLHLLHEKGWHLVEGYFLGERKAKRQQIRDLSAEAELHIRLKKSSGHHWMAASKPYSSRGVWINSVFTTRIEDLL